MLLLRSTTIIVLMTLITGTSTIMVAKATERATTVTTDARAGILALPNNWPEN
jgi:hypothetical protein